MTDCIRVLINLVGLSRDIVYRHLKLCPQTIHIVLEEGFGGDIVTTPDTLEYFLETMVVHSEPVLIITGVDKLDLVANMKLYRNILFYIIK